MYDYIHGKFSYKVFSDKGFFVTVETAGIGYRFEIIERDFNNLPDINSDLKLYCVLLHKEDKMSLCGFMHREDRDIFNVLVSVSGVGTKMAITLLNSFAVPDLVEFVIDGNYKELTKAKGVGTKLAQKIILELKDKLASFKNASQITTLKTTSAVSVKNQNVSDAENVLLSLGYEKEEISIALTKAVNSLNENAKAEEILKKSLRLLSVS